MANQWSARIVSQSSHFRGISTVGVVSSVPVFPSTRAIMNAVYVLRVTGGVSGSFGVNVLGQVGMQGTALLPNGMITGVTVALAGVTGIGAVGTYVLFPYGYSVSGVGTLVDAADVIHRLDRIVPPSAVAFESGIATAGISAHCVVSAVLWTGR